MKILKPAFLLALATVALSGCEKKSAVRYEYTAVSRGSVQNTVSAVGTLGTKETVAVQGSASGILDALYVLAGDKVFAGQKIADINTSGYSYQKGKAENAENEAESTE